MLMAMVTVICYIVMVSNGDDHGLVHVHEHGQVRSGMEWSGPARCSLVRVLGPSHPAAVGGVGAAPRGGADPGARALAIARALPSPPLRAGP